MTWVRLDDGFADHPKIIGLSAQAVSLHVWALCWCSRHLTDGFLPTAAPSASPWRTDAATGELVDAGVWSQIESGYTIHDFLDYQPSAEDVKRKRTLKAERQARWLENKKRRAPRKRRATTPSEASPSSPLLGGGEGAASSGTSIDASEDESSDYVKPTPEEAAERRASLMATLPKRGAA